MKISQHAIERFRERTGAKYADEKIEEKLQHMVSGSVPVQLKPRYRIFNIMRNNYRESNFHKYNGTLLISRDDTLVTFINGKVPDKFEEIT